MTNGNVTTTATGAAGACASEIRSRLATEAVNLGGRLVVCGPTGRASRCQIRITLLVIYILRI